ncbi:MAG: ATP-binding protein [Leptospiraceae bacterium]|nr:ATP-binding protein [Leptospiraceae bacterium]MCP5498291.1 ATP-binding protein [Leptospiraceae bacterium]
MKLDHLLTVRAGLQNCQDCKGVGIILDELLPGSRSGELAACHCMTDSCKTCFSKGKAPYLSYDSERDRMVPCECHEARVHISRLNTLMGRAKIPSKYRFRFLSSIDFEGDSMISLLAACDWADELVNHFPDTAYWKNRKKGMHLWGGTGSGKTLLACAILNELIFRYGIKCRYVKINDFLNSLRETYQKTSEFHGQERSIGEEFMSVDVLVIDDFGVQKDTEWANSKLYDLIDSRYEREKTTLLTSNDSPEEWKERGEGRVYSRLCEMTQDLHIECPDYRLRF